MKGSAIPSVDGSRRSAPFVTLVSSPFAAGLLTSIGYYLGAKLGFILTLQPQPVSVLWPPNAILLAGMLLTPPRWWGFIVLMVAPAHWASQLQHGVPDAMILCWFISNACEALFGAACIRRLCGGGKLHLDSFRNIAIFLAFAVFLAPFLSSFLDAAFVALNRWGESDYWDVWRTRVFSNALATLTLVGFIVSWSDVLARGVRKSTRRAVPEAAFLALCLVLVSFLVFVHVKAGGQTRGALLYTPLPFLLWAAVRFEVAGATASVLAVTLISIWGAAHGRGPFASRSPLENALSLQIFLVCVSIPQLCLAATLAERRKAEEALRASEERYREVIETQTDLICRFLPDTTLTFVNQAYCRFFNRRREDLIGLKFIELIPEPERTRSLERIAAVVKAPHVLTVEHQVLLPDGTHGWNQWVNHPICGPDGRVVEFQAIGRDISDRKRVEEATAKLVHVSRLAMVGELTASIAHEINQPLQAILTNAGAASILLEVSPEKIDEVKQILLDIRKDDARASEVIAHIRKLLRKRQFEIHAVQVNELISDVIRFVRAEGLRRNVIFETRLQAPLPNVNADPVHVQQVLLNLVLNGLDAITEAPKDKRRLVLTSSLLEPGEVGVSVYDTGGGIAPERLPKLFEPFFTTKPEGMGLGLSISRAIIEMHRGRIWGENNPAGGAAFHFTLPAQGRGLEPEAAPQSSAAG